MFLLQPRGRLPALMGTFGWLTGELNPKAGWKSASMGDGEQCVMTLGEPKKLRWSADSRGTQLKVGASPSVCLSVCTTPVRLSVCLHHTCPSVCLSVCTTPVRLSVCLSAPHLSVCLRLPKCKLIFHSTENKCFHCRCCGIEICQLWTRS